jgi:hypothetical protein
MSPQTLIALWSDLTEDQQRDLIDCTIEYRSMNRRAPTRPRLRLVASHPSDQIRTSDTVPALRIVSRRPATRVALQLPTSGSEVA